MIRNCTLLIIFIQIFQAVDYVLTRSNKKIMLRACNGVIFVN